MNADVTSFGRRWKTLGLHDKAFEAQDCGLAWKNQKSCSENF
jgi:hypothetical protein